MKIDLFFIEKTGAARYEKGIFNVFNASMLWLQF